MEKNVRPECTVRTTEIKKYKEFIYYDLSKDIRVLIIGMHIHVNHINSYSIFQTPSLDFNIFLQLRNICHKFPQYFCEVYIVSFA